MRLMLLCGAAAAVLLAVPAAADNSPTNKAKSVDPHQLAVQLKKPPLKLDDTQRAAIQDALAGVHTQQKAPKDFKPQVGAAVPKGVKIDPMPQELGRQVPAMKEYGYAKTATDILVIDPMSKKIAAVVPRKFAADPNAKQPTPADWANTRGRELTGQSPQGAGNTGQSFDLPGNGAAVGNGNAANTQPEESGLHHSDPGKQ